MASEKSGGNRGGGYHPPSPRLEAAAEFSICRVHRTRSAADLWEKAVDAVTMVFGQALREVEQSCIGVIEKWGRFDRLAQPGLQFFNPFAGECVAGFRIVWDDNELEMLEIIHHFVEILDRYFGSASPEII
ncbi:hypersensitive-induced response protein 4 [Phtheirospermum japonicum]|uniref:Hypersensitive-induced response protein 4 n=1 Tax=Phtheirospermum japonicum TaxID=374723 RepID=A0A830BKF5_9LAMI|nr:hypersensitive-induced response protein 4 [Phtheirospermum japonicum]